VQAIFKDPLIIEFFDHFATHGALDDLNGFLLFGLIPKTLLLL